MTENSVDNQTGPVPPALGGHADSIGSANRANRGGRFFTTQHADPSALNGERVAVIGYGHLGRPFALNLRDLLVMVDQIAGRQPFRIQVPIGLAKLTALFDEGIFSRLTGQPPQKCRWPAYGWPAAACGATAARRSESSGCRRRRSNRPWSAL